MTSGGKAPGPQPLRECLVKLRGVLDTKENGDKLSPIEVHDMICHIADAVLAGGIRRAAFISLFSADDDEMIACKAGSWWETNPQRGRANNSIVLMRHIVTKEFLKMFGSEFEQVVQVSPVSTLHLIKTGEQTRVVRLLSTLPVL